jgi:hypothetical protein
MSRVVVFKDEGVIDGEPYGPVRVVKPEDLGVKGRPLTVPFELKCVCERPSGEPDTLCQNCNRRVEPEWVTRETAQQMAETLGLELKEV